MGFKKEGREFFLWLFNSRNGCTNLFACPQFWPHLSYPPCCPCISVFTLLPLHPVPRPWARTAPSLSQWQPCRKKSSRWGRLVLFSSSSPCLFFSLPDFCRLSLSLSPHGHCYFALRCCSFTIILRIFRSVYSSHLRVPLVHSPSNRALCKV